MKNTSWRTLANIFNQDFSLFCYTDYNFDLDITIELGFMVVLAYPIVISNLAHKFFLSYHVIQILCFTNITCN